METEPQGNLPLLVVLMAGGGGTRLWPFSRPEEPKQCLPLLGGRSLFELTVERLEGVAAPQDVFVVSNRRLERLLRAARTPVPDRNFFSEPSPRNTAPAAAFALACLRARVPQFVMACLPSDHFIADVPKYRALVRAAQTLAERGYLVTLGIDPSGPLTGYGYIEQGDALGPVEGFPAYRVRRFTEKPDLEQAREMIRRGGFSWNSGMFFWRSDVIAEEFRRHQPAIAAVLDPLTDAVRGNAQAGVFERLWEGVPSVSLDYGILEKSERVAVLSARDLGWTDIGSWDALVELYRERPELRSSAAGRHLDAGSKSVTVLRRIQDDRILATVGLEDVIIVETDDAILVCRSGRSQDVREIYNAVYKK
ncbi:MAG: NTP transferase domain-containing protein [Anaerolineales bacterium]|nr:NTP transferase domain-containing protein [Anaerolineales bacterium]